MSILLQAEVSTASAANALRENSDDLADFLAELAALDELDSDITELGGRISDCYPSHRAEKVSAYLRCLADAIDWKIA